MNLNSKSRLTLCHSVNFVIQSIFVNYANLIIIEQE